MNTTSATLIVKYRLQYCSCPTEVIQAGILRFCDFEIEAAIEFERLIPKSINLEIVCLT